MLELKAPYWVTLVFLGVLAAFPIAQPTSYKIDHTISPLFSAFPNAIGEWTGEDTKVDERTYEILETRNVLSRTYKNPAGDGVHLLLVGSHKDRRVAHPPEVCYLGSNFTITNEAESKLATEDAPLGIREFTAKSEKNPNYQEHVLYLYKVGDRFTTNYYAQQIQFALDRLSQKDSRVLLIRLAGSSRDRLLEFLPLVLAQID